MYLFSVSFVTLRCSVFEIRCLGLTPYRPRCLSKNFANLLERLAVSPARSRRQEVGTRLRFVDVQLRFDARLAKLATHV